MCVVRDLCWNAAHASSKRPRSVSASPLMLAYWTGGEPSCAASAMPSSQVATHASKSARIQKCHIIQKRCSLRRNGSRRAYEAVAQAHRLVVRLLDAREAHTGRGRFDLQVLVAERIGEGNRLVVVAQRLRRGSPASSR